MKHHLLTLCVASALLACGGGGNEAQVSLSTSEAVEAEQKKATGTLPTELPGDPETRSTGKLKNGGFLVSWVSQGEVHLQRYNKGGKPVGEATQVPFPQDPPITGYVYQHNPVLPAVAVQANGEVAVVYLRVRPATEVDPAASDATQQHLGIYLKRFSATGVQLQGETEIASMLRFVPGAVHFAQELRLLPLSDGSFVASWGIAYRGGLGATQVDYFMRRFDAAGVPVTGVLVPVVNYWCANRYLNSTFEWDADDMGGFSIVGTIYPKENMPSQCDGFGPPVEQQVYTYYPGLVLPSESKQEKRKACMALASGLKGQERKKQVDSCLAKLA